MKAARAIPSAATLTWGVDTLAPLSREHFIALVRRGCSFRGGYIFDITPLELANQLTAGLSFFPICRAMQLDGPACAARLKELQIPLTVTVWCDVEGMGLEAPSVIARVNAWAAVIVAAGYEAGMYVGAGCPLTARELSDLAVTRYWHSCSRALCPDRGYCMRQLRPDDVFVAGVKVDVDIVEPDYRGDLPTFVTG